MKRYFKLIFSELIWPLICLILTLSFIISFWDWQFKRHFVSIDFWGTPVAFSDLDLVICIWLLIILIVYSVKEVKSNYKRIVPNLIAISAGLIFIVSLSFINVGWTWYPALASLGAEGLTFTEFNNIILGFRIFAGLFVLHTAYRWIKSRTMPLDKASENNS
jgi:hypothetical protein